jgi:hypothetical protein
MSIRDRLVAGLTWTSGAWSALFTGLRNRRNTLLAVDTITTLDIVLDYIEARSWRAF